MSKILKKFEPFLSDTPNNKTLIHKGVTSLTPCHPDAHTYVNGQRIHQTTILAHGSLVKFGNSNTYRFLDPSQEERTRHPSIVPDAANRVYDSNFIEVI
ncbi:hypothetical protein HHI36_004708 [Cryptolaemus montrouzieri]|uniref:FHA domain-containing protein n=1 Tax=Cryptolaemus montrouzieri TaxID=559131 RepID=A0ABD2NSY2_9CUCU